MEQGKDSSNPKPCPLCGSPMEPGIRYLSRDEKVSQWYHCTNKNCNHQVLEKES